MERTPGRWAIYPMVAGALSGLVSIATSSWRPLAVALTACLVCAGFAAGFVRYRKQATKNKGLSPPDGPAEPGSTVTSADRKAEKPSTLARRERAEFRRRIGEAVRTVRDSRLGERRGRAALYELPWAMLIGGHDAGKTQAVLRSGLRFPLGNEQGSGPVAHSSAGGDWFFTATGVFIDVASRYTGTREHRESWIRFLGVLRRARPRAPINSLIVAVSLESLLDNDSGPDHAATIEQHAADLRQQIHDVAEHLHVSVPVYVLFTKADVIGGFADFFASLTPEDRSGVWGATLPVADGHATKEDRFGAQFDELAVGLRSHASERMASIEGQLPASVLTLPAEFASYKPALARFIALLFEENPFQFHPCFRGFYFCSALPSEDTTSPLMLRTKERFALKASASSSGAEDVAARKVVDHGYFLTRLFRDVIFADRSLVKPIRTRKSRRRLVALGIGTCLGGGVVFALLASAYRNNAQFVRNVEADLIEVRRLQEDRIDLRSRLDAMLVLQDRLQQLIAYRNGSPWSFRPLYREDRLIATVRREYFAGMRELMVVPTSQQMEAYLMSFLAGGASSTQVADSPYPSASAKDKGEAYDVLKAYLMLADAHRAEQAHLASQLTRFWRVWLEQHRGSMAREELVDRAGKLISLHVSLANETDWPTIQPRAALVDDTRRLLGEAMKGTPARDRVYADIVARASARYPAIVVRDMVGGAAGSPLTGSYAVPGAYSVAAWNGYVKQAIGDASRKALDTSDWVLKNTHVDDLTLSGSPEHVRKELQGIYAARYIDEWQKFLAGVGIADFPDFGHAVAAMERLGDSETSPIRKVLERASAETAWDRARGVVTATTAKAGAGDVAGLDEVQASTAVPEMLATAGADGPVAREFAGLARMVDARDGTEAPLRAYLAALGRLRTRLNGIANEGDLGPGSRRLLEATLQGKASELADALRVTDDHMLAGLTDRQRQSLRPLLLRPLMQTFSALVPHAERELDRVWTAQVYNPFATDLARKFPFDENGRVEATAEEVATVFGPTGSIAHFASESLAPVVERRGDTLTPRQWGNHGIVLSPALLADFPQWVAPIGSTVAGPQTIFQLMPEPTPTGVTGYTVSIAGQSLHYRNEPAQWSNFAWGGSTSSPTVSIEATRADGTSVRIADFQGTDALGELVRTADRRRADDGTHVLTWSRDGVTIGMRLKIVSAAQVDADGAAKRGLRGIQLPSSISGGDRALASVGTGAGAGVRAVTETAHGAPR